MNSSGNEAPAGDVRLLEEAAGSRMLVEPDNSFGTAAAGGEAPPLLPSLPHVHKGEATGARESDLDHDLGIGVGGAAAAGGAQVMLAQVVNRAHAKESVRSLDVAVAREVPLEEATVNKAFAKVLASLRRDHYCCIDLSSAINHLGEA
jgi:hypothetical protein